MRRIAAALIAFLAFTATLLVLPVYAAPAPEAQPVPTSTDSIELGSVADPAPAADVQEGTTDPVAGVDDTPTLTVSQPSTAPFSLVGVTWTYDTEVTDTVVQVRVKDDAGAWGGWTEVTPETLDQTTTQSAPAADLRGGTAPLWTGPSNGVEVELVTRTGARPADVRLNLVDPGTSAADSSLTSPAITDTANAASSMPAVYSRAQWGADESLRTWAPQYAPTIKAATLHHTADANNYTEAQVPAIMRSIYRYHTVSLGWGDIGYNVIVDKFGRLWEGRYGGLASTVVGAHAAGFNTGTFGVSMLGNYDIAPVPQATVDAVSAIIAWKFSLYGVNPKSTTVLTSDGKYGTSKYAKGVKVTLPTIFGHRDVGSTVCPGRYGYARLPEIRTAVAERMTTTVDAVTTRYDSSAAVQRALGAPTTAVKATSTNSGLYRDYAKGSIYWSAKTGARYVLTSVRTRYLAAGGVGGALGYPTGDTVCSSSGCSQTFQGGSVLWSKATGAHFTGGKVGARYAALGGASSALGYPTNDVACGLVRAGCWQKYSGGRIYYQKAAGVHMLSGAVLELYKAQTYQKGALGYPTSDAGTTTDGRAAFADFEGGSLYSMGVGTVWHLSPAVVQAWAATGRERGPMGYPVTVAAASAAPSSLGTVVQRFQSGFVYSSTRGTFAVGGAVYRRWMALGGASGELGVPTSNLTVDRAGGQYAVFAGGSVAWSSTTGVRRLGTAVTSTWLRAGGPSSVLGYPVADQRSTADGTGVAASFSGGVVFSSPATGTRWVGSAIAAKWQLLHWQKGVLGYPTSSQKDTADGRGSYVHFQGGTLSYDKSTTKVTARFS